MLAIIPARGGSKGLPGKNIKELHGKPLIAYSIETALNSKYVTSVFVSTDDEEIAKIARFFGAQCPWLRPAHLATDDALAVDTYIHVIDKLESLGSDKIENFIVLQPTSPLRTAEDINNAVEMFITKNADSVISYTEDEKPINWSKYVEKDNRLTNIFPESIKNRQSLKKTYHPNGAIYVFATKLIREKKYYSNNTFAYLMDRKKSIDIDTLDDFLYAEFLLKKEKNNR